MEVIGINVNYFKKSGKWYMSETLDVPVGLSYFEVRNWIIENRPFKNEFHMVINDEFSEEVIGYPMLDLALEGA